MRRNKATSNDNKTKTQDISSPTEIHATAWKDANGNWKNLSINMFLTDNEDEDSTNGIVLIRNSRLRDFARSLRMKDKCSWHLKIHAKMTEILENYRTTHETRHFSTNRIQLMIHDAMGNGRKAYTRTGCLFIDPVSPDENPTAFLFINDEEYTISFDQECTEKQKAKYGAYRGQTK